MKAVPSDLQSDPFGHSGISPRLFSRCSVLTRAPRVPGRRGARFAVPDGIRECVGGRARAERHRSRVILGSLGFPGSSPRRDDRRSPASGGRLGPGAGGSQRRDSNPQPPDYKSGALPVELRWPAPRAARPRPGESHAGSPGASRRQVERRMVRPRPTPSRPGPEIRPVLGAFLVIRKGVSAGNPRGRCRPAPASPRRTSRGKRR